LNNVKDRRNRIIMLMNLKIKVISFFIIITMPFFKTCKLYIRKISNFSHSAGAIFAK